MARTFQEQVYALVRAVPMGCVTSYGQLAMMTGRPRASRIIGCMMAKCSDPSMPCHRVLHRDGSLCNSDTFGPMQRQLLHDEGVVIEKNGRVDMQKYGWTGVAQQEAIP